MSAGLSAGVIAAVAVGGATVAGAAISANAASNAASQQSAAATTAAGASLQATNNTNALQWQMYQQSLLNQSPYMQTGNEANAALANWMGLGTPNVGGNGSYAPAAGAQPNQPTTATPNVGGNGASAPATQPTGGTPATQPTTLASLVAQPGGAGGAAAGIPVAAPGSTTTGGFIDSVAAPGSTPAAGSTTTGGSTGSTPAAGSTTTGGSTGSASGVNLPGIGNAAPTNYGASQAQTNAAAGSTPFGGGLATFNNSDLSSQIAPNYAFQLNQGEQALKSNLAATGMLQTGQGLKNINDYAQNSAAGAYQQAFTNWNTQQNNIYSRLSGIVTPGTGATNNASNAAVQTGSNIGQTTMAGTAAANNYLTGAAAANAAGNVGVANAINGGVQSGIGNYFGSQVMNKYLNSGTPAGGGQAPNNAPGVTLQDIAQN